RFRRGDAAERAAIYRLYLAHTDCVNNWDLVDSSAPYIVGAYLEDRDSRVLSRLARSASLWERRIAIVATLHLIRGNRFDETLMIAGLLLRDGHDLIHKAVGWMLREVGKRDLSAEKTFLNKHYTVMPRTMLRYAIEKFPPEDRKMYLERVA
ncbi:MAG: DNA alkylation repair protein, partial [Gammaproteobacteria bacterium]